MVVGQDHTYVPGFTVQQIVQITSGPNVNRILYRSGRRVPFFVTTYAEAFVNKYTTYVTAGDLELGFDQKCSYGHSSDAAAWNVQVTISLKELYSQQSLNWVPFASHFTGEGALLYYV